MFARHFALYIALNEKMGVGHSRHSAPTTHFKRPPSAKLKLSYSICIANLYLVTSNTNNYI